MAKFYRTIFFLLTVIFAGGFSLESFGQGLIQDIFAIRECERIAEYRVRGGTPPYTYVWTLNGVVVQEDIGLDATQTSILTQAQSGTYEVTVTDAAGATRTASFPFSESSNFILDIEILEDQECEGTTFGRIVGIIEDGIAPFSITIINEIGQVVLANQPLPGREINLSGYPAGIYLIEVEDANGCREITEVELEEIPPLTFEEGAGLGAFPVTCEDNGSIAYNVQNSEGDVRFRIRRADGSFVNNWTVTNPNGEIRFDGLPIGDYVLEIADDFRTEACPAELPFSIVDEVLFVFENTPENIVCFGDTNGSIRFDIIRNFTDFTPLPNQVELTLTNASGVVIETVTVPIGVDSGFHIFNNLGVGVYTITTRHGGVDYPECVQTFTVEIEGPDSPLTASIVGTNELCFGDNDGTATVTASGGWGDYTYLWSNGGTNASITGLAPGDYWVDITDAGGCTIREEITIIGPSAAITADIRVINDLTCVGANDGRAIIENIQGGYGGYTIQWSVGGQTTAEAIELPAGNISVTVTDSEGCSATFFTELVAPPAPDVLISESMVSCFGADDGSVRIQINGTDDYTVVVAGQTQTGNDVTFSNLLAGNYTATISYGGNCNIARTFTITSPNAVVINRSNVIKTEISCFGQEDGAISGLTASGGTGALSVQWQQEISGTFENIPGASNFNISNLGPGTYRIIVTDENGCLDEFTYEFTEPAPLQVSPPSITDVTCFGGTNGSVSFTITGGRAPYAYRLNGGTEVLTNNNTITIPNLPASTGNIIEIRDASNCTVDSFTFDIASAPPIEIELVEIIEETCFGQNNGGININIGGGSGVLSVRWFRSNNLNDPISTNQNLTNVGPGTYTVRVFDAGNEFCFASAEYTIAPTPEIEVSLAGSPVNVLCFGEETGAININASGGTGELTFAWTGPNGFTSTQQNISNLTAGDYQVRVTDANGCFKDLVDILITQPATGITINTLLTTSPLCSDSNDGSIQMQVFGGQGPYTLSWERQNSVGDFEFFPGTGLSLTSIPAGNYRLTATDANGCSIAREVVLTAPDELVITVTNITDVSCFDRNDGRIDIEVTGGTGPYTFEWDHGFVNQNPSNLSAGTYAVTVRDVNGCVTRLENIQVIQPAQTRIDEVFVSAPSCDFNDGRIEVAFVGGDATFTSTWFSLPSNTPLATNTNVLEGITPGAYRVEYGNGTSCTVSRIFVVPGPTNPLQLNISAQDPTCDNDNGIIAISASGGTPGYTFFIEIDGNRESLNSTILANREAGDYTIIVVDNNGCEVARTITISNPNQPIYEVEKIQDVSCFGGNDGIINFTTFGNMTGITFQWFRRELTGALTPINENELSQLTAGTYFVRFTYDNNCTLNSEDIIITQPDQLIITNTVTQLLCFDDLGSISFTISGGNSGKTLTLTGPNAFSQTENNIFSGTFSFENLSPGVYTWTLNDAGCPEQTGTITINSVQRPAFTLSKTDVICFGDSNGSIDVSDILLENNRTYTIILNGVNRGLQSSFTNLPAGLYTIQIVDSQGCESEFQSIQINQPDRALEIFNLATSDATCFGGNDGSVAFELLGGTTPYTYTLSGANGFSISESGVLANTTITIQNLLAGNYTLEVVDATGNCQTAGNFSINQPTALVFNREIGQIACPEGTTFIRLLLSGGTSPYNYTWERLDSSGNWELLAENGNELTGIVAGTYRYIATDANSCEIFTDIVEIPEAAPVSLSFIADDILCFGGNTQVTLNASRPGFSNFTYFVNGNQIFGNTFPAIAGDYEVFARDNINGCVSDTITISINQPAEPLSFSNFTTSQLSCFESNDGVISFVLNGGTAPYRVTFQGEERLANAGEVLTFNSLAANIPYGFDVVDANGCLLTIPSVILTQPFPIQVNSSFTPIQCFGGTGSIVIQATGGRAPFTIQWEYAVDGVNFASAPEFDQSFTLNNLPAGAYRYTLTDNGGCPPVVETIVLNQPTQTTLTFDATDVSCFGGNDGSVRLFPSGGPSTNYQLFFNGQLVTGNEVFGLSAGTYEAFAISGGCPSEIVSITIEQPAEALTAQVSFPAEVLCHNDLASIEVSIVGGNGIYEASIAGNFLPVDSSGMIIFENVAPGTYTVEVRDQKGCTFTEVITIGNPLPLELDLVALENVSCADGDDGFIEISIQGGTGSYTYTWIDANGNTIGSNARIENLAAGIYQVIVQDANGCEISETFEIESVDPVTVTLTDQINVSCHNGTNGGFTISADGGNGGYRLFVDGLEFNGFQISGLAAGTYEVFVMDSKGCVSPTIIVTITQPEPLAVTFNVTPITCFGANDGMVNLLISGGVGPYEILWSDGSTSITRENLAPGMYEVTVTDANGCIQTISTIEITQPQELVVTSSFTPIQCLDGEGSIQVQVSGGRAPLSIYWEYAANGMDFTAMPEFDGLFELDALKAGAYRFTVSDNGGCPPVVETIVLEQPTETVLAVETGDVSCFGGNDGFIRFLPSGGPSATYQLFLNGELITGTEALNLTAGTYEVYAVSGGCPSEILSVTINEPAEALQVNIDYPAMALCHNDLASIELSISGGNGIYEASIAGNFLPVDSNGLIIFENVAPGTYTVEVRDQKGCSFSEIITIGNPLPLELNLIELENVSCPNGDDGFIEISTQGGTGSYTYTWLDANGTVIGSNPRIENLSPGIYQVIVQDANGCEIRESFEIEDVAALTIQASNISHVSCHGEQNGSFTILASGGNGNYRLFVNGTPQSTLQVSGLAAGIYEAYVQDSKGCLSPTLTIEITEPDPLAVSLDRTEISCFGANDGQATISISGGTGPYQVRWSDGSAELNRTNLIPGNYEVVVIDANGCMVRTNLLFEQPSPLNASGQVSPVTCFGGNDGGIVLAVSGGTAGYSIRWVDASNNEVGQGNELVNAFAGEYTAEITDSNGCRLDRTFIISEPFEALSLTPFISNIRCAGESNGRIDLLVAGGTAPYTFQWSSGETTRSITNKTAGIYDVEVRDANGCVLVQSFEISSPDPINISASSISDVSCKFGNDGSIDLSVSGGIGPYQIFWSNGDIGPSIRNLRAGIYIAFVFDDNTCFASETFIIQEPSEELSVIAVNNSEICNPDDDTGVSLTVTGGTAPYSYLWSNGSTASELINVPAGLYSVLVTDANGCTVETDVEVQEPAPGLQLTLEGTTAICASGGRAEVTANVTGGVAPYSYRWSNGSSSPTLSSLVPGVYTLTVTDAIGCSVVEDIEIFPPLNLGVRLENIQGVSCFGGNDGSITIGLVGGMAPFEIEWSNGVRGVTSLTNLRAGTYSVTVSDATGCSTTATYNLREPEVLTFTESVNNISCHGANDGSIQLDILGGTAPYTFQWSHGFNGRNPRNLAPGMYTVIITDRNGCSTGGTFGISQPEPLQLEGNHSADLLCFGDAQGFINVNISGGMQPYRVIWSDDPNEQSFNRTNLLAGSYKITVIDDNNCVIEETFDIRQPQNLEARLSHRFDVDCENQELTGVAWLDISGGSGEYDIWWYNGETGSEETRFFNSEEVLAIVTDSNGCRVEVSARIEMPLVFTQSDFMYTIPSLGTTGEILVNDPVLFFDRTLGNVIAWEWDFGDGNTSTEQNPSHTYRRPGIYTISLRTFDIYGCISEATIVVEVLASYRILIPNAFTPNGDGLNDTFFPKMRGIATFEFYIFNKWGELIYTNLENADEGWDGTLNGRMSPNGNYVYKLVYTSEDGETGTRTGVFTLVN